MMPEKLSAIERAMAVAATMSIHDSRRVIKLICEAGMMMDKPVMQEPSEGAKHYAKREGTIKRMHSSCGRVLDYAKHETLRNIERHFRETPPITSAEGAPDSEPTGTLAARLTFKRPDFTTELLAALREEALSALTIAGQQLFDEVGRDDPWKMPGEQSTGFLNYRANLLADVPDEVHKTIMSEIQQGLDAGDSRRELMKRISTKFDETYKGRMETVANTETAAAFNFARDRAMKEAGVTHKKWLLSHSPLIKEHRATHAQNDGQVQPIDEPFDIGGVQFMYPGDDTLGAGPEDIINCHCVAIPVEAPVKSGEGEGHPFRGNQWTKLPNFSPLPEVQKVAETYGVNPEWKQAPANWTSKRSEFGTIAIAPKHSADLGVQLHELGHDVWANKITLEGKGAARRLHTWAKGLPKFGAEYGSPDRSWRILPNGEKINVTHGAHNAPEEIFTQLFALYHTGKLQGDAKSAMEMMLTNPKYIRK